MNESRTEFKVGVFLFVGVALLALLVLNFSKGVTLGKPTYTLRVILPNAAGLKPAADVMMSGVPIGKVTTMELAGNSKSVNITIKILERYKIRKDAQFSIDSLGFLGDQYVEVSAPMDDGLTPTNEIIYLQNGESVNGAPTFNMLQAVQSISGIIDQAKKAIKDLDQAITNVNNSALSTNTLGHFVKAVSNLEVVSEKAAGTAARAENMLGTNEAAIRGAINNFQALSAQLTNTAAQLNHIIVTNQGDIRTVVTNLAAASEQFRQIAADLEAGKGPVGSLLKDDTIKTQIATIVSNANIMTAEFGMFGHNLNQRGIWAMLWRPKPERTNQVSSSPSHVHER